MFLSAVCIVYLFSKVLIIISQISSAFHKHPAELSSESTGRGGKIHRHQLPCRRRLISEDTVAGERSAPGGGQPEVSPVE